MGDRGHDHGRPLIPVEEIQRRILSAVKPLPPVELPLREAHGLVSAANVESPSDLPPFVSSAMDGFAVRAADVADASPKRPVILALAGEVRMGRGPEVSVDPGEAVGIPTGGAIPPGAESVVPIEDCEVEDGKVHVFAAAPLGQYVRPAGEDVRAGDVVAPAGRRLLAGDLGLLASAGIPAVPVRPRPRVLLVSTGDELVDPGTPAGPGRIPDANAFTLHGAVAEAGADPVAGGRVPDDPEALVGALRANLDLADVVITSGGVSVGERDPVKGAFAKGDVDLYEVAMQPGKPQAFGTFEGRPFFGLPGNPVSVFVSFEMFVRPALMVMMGRPPFRPEVTAVLETELGGLPNKTVFARVRLRRGEEGWVAASTGGRRSNLLATVSRGNGLAIVPAGEERLAAGSSVRVLPFRDPEEP